MDRVDFITPEYPPQVGGVADHTRALATALASANVEVHVWAPGERGTSIEQHNVTVHRIMGCFSRQDLQRTNRLLDAQSAHRRLFIQWVPHGFGYRSMNVAFAFWLWQRARLYRDRIEVMVHEPGLPFTFHNPRASSVAAIHRLMLAIMIDAADKVWMSTSSWESLLRTWSIRRSVDMECLPVPSNIPVCHEYSSAAVRHRYASPDELLIGSFGTFGNNITPLLTPLILELLTRRRNLRILLIGRGSDDFAARLRVRVPQHALRVHASGVISSETLSLCLQASDLLIQPYPDGISTRRGTAMAVLEHGRPMVTNCGMLSERFWQDSRAVTIAKSPEPACLIEPIFSLLDCHPERYELGKNAARFYDDHFHLRHVIRRLTSSHVSTSSSSVPSPCEF